MGSRTVRELEEKIEAKSKALQNTIKSQINKKQNELNKNLEDFLRHETSNLKKVSLKVIKKAEDKSKEYNRRIEKIRIKVSELDSKLNKLITECEKYSPAMVKNMLDKEIKGLVGKYENLRDQQKAVYKKEFDSLEKNCSKISSNEVSKLKNLM